MNPCQNDCLKEDCLEPAIFYTNFSRFHKICHTHSLEQNLEQNKEIKENCRHCKNQIKIAKDFFYSDLVIEKMRGLYEKFKLNDIRDHETGYGRNDEFQNIEKSQKCLYYECQENVLEYRCEYHQLCYNHFELNDWVLCNNCLCLSCKLSPTYVSKNNSICSNCYLNWQNCVELPANQNKIEEVILNGSKNLYEEDVMAQQVLKENNESLKNSALKPFNDLKQSEIINKTNFDNESSLQILKCSFNECDNNAVKYRCSNHLYCSNHLECSSWEECYECTCSYCKRQNCYIFYGIENICSECYVKRKCIYCQEVGKNQFNECEHYFCDTHLYPLYFCFCKKCLGCGKGPVKTKSCFHEFECTCESKQLCFNCIKNDSEKHLSSDEKNDVYQVLNKDTKLDSIIFGNNSPKSVKILDSNSKVNEEKKNKVIEEEKKISKNQESNNQGYFALKGTDISNKVQNSLKISTNKNILNRDEKMDQLKSEFCSGCGINEIYKKYDCLHSFCKNCFKNGICLICYDGSYCNGCSSFDKKNLILLCLHGKCKECITRQKCTECLQCSVCQSRIETKTLQGCVHSKCITCQSKQCLLCKSSSCAECGAKEVYKKFKNCSHSFCKKHAKNICNRCIKCSKCQMPAKEEEMCGHLFCSGCVKECQNCLCTKCKQNKVIKVYKCGHTCCSQCFNDYCQSCFVDCELCCQISEKHSDLSCGHKVCKKCYKSACFVCKDYLFCKVCKTSSYHAINFTCVHGKCINCIKKGSCEKCFCPEGHDSILGTIKDCRHFKCIKCPSTSKNCDECHRIECNLCGTFLSNKKIIDKCGHRACENCFVIKNCYECDGNPYCKLCHTKKEQLELSNNNCCLNCKSQIV